MGAGYSGKRGEGDGGDFLGKKIKDWSLLGLDGKPAV